jgi:hypothetical protein
MSDAREGSPIRVGDVADSTLIGFGLEGDGHIVGREVTVHRNVIHIHAHTPESLEALRRIIAIPTEVQAAAAEPAPAAAPAAGAPAPDLHRSIDELLSLIRAAGTEGEEPQKVEAGDLQVSRVDLLLRKAVLLASEADRITLASMGGDAAVHAAGMDAGALSDLLAGTDPPEALEKLREAMRHLREACALDGRNTEVLLHMVLVFARLSPRHLAVPEERQMLQHILLLLRDPQTERERLHRAQATYLLGTVGQERNRAMLSEARAAFATLGRQEWVRRCDEMLAASRSRPVDAPRFAPPLTSSPDGASAWWWIAGTGAAAVGLVFLLALAALDEGLGNEDAAWLDGGSSEYALPAAHAPFTPAGDWRVEVGDQWGSVMLLRLGSDGALSGSQTAAGVSFGISGWWSWDPSSSELVISGTVEGVGPAEVRYRVEQGDGTAFVAREPSGLLARFERL